MTCSVRRCWLLALAAVLFMAAGVLTSSPASAATTAQGLLQVGLTPVLWDAGPQGGCLRAEEVPRGVQA